jgi:hypothetical protein
MRHLKSWRLPTVLFAVALAGIGAAVVVSRATAAPSQAAQPDAHGSCAALTNDPAAVKAMQNLHDEHAKDTSAWQSTYGANPTSREARNALAKLHREHQKDMRALFARLGITAPAGFCGAGTTGGSMMGGTTGGMMGGASGMMSGSSSGASHAQHHGGGASSSGTLPGVTKGSGMMGAGL